MIQKRANKTAIFDFLNTAASGSAHRSSTLTIRSFLTSIGVSLCIGAIEVLVFSVLRTKLVAVYQSGVSGPNQIRNTSRKDLFSWLLPLIRSDDISDYLGYGLDAYFFLRFLNVLMRFFLVITVFSNVILLPVNFSGNYALSSNRNFFDSMSMSNISPDKSDLYVAHFIISVVVIGLFHFLLIEELSNYAVIKRNLKTGVMEDAIVMIDNVPSHFADYSIIRYFFDILPGGVKDILFVYDGRDILSEIKAMQKERDLLERAEYKFINSVKQHRNKTDCIGTSFKTARPRIIPYSNILGFDVKIPFFKKKVDAINFHSQRMKCFRDMLLRKKEELLSSKRPFLGKIFIQFNSAVSAHISNQIILFENYNKMNHQEVDLKPDDMIWKNVIQKRGKVFFLKNLVARLLAILVTICWVIPVSVIGIVAQLPYLTKLVPILTIVNSLPLIVRGFISSILPTIALALLMEIVFWVFAKLSILKGKSSGLKCQLDLQNWLFMFLFVELFLVVTISSGITVIVENLLNNPVSIPTLLATDLPKASNFFLSFLVMRSLIYTGNTLLQPKTLFMTLIMPLITTWTPRRRSEQIAYEHKLYWGTIYPTFAVFGCIATIYSIISPLISIFASFCFFAVGIGFKYNLSSVYPKHNVSESHGRFYPTALLQLYAGIYCLELALLGIFMLQKCHFLAFATVLGFALTIVANTQVKSKYCVQSTALISEGEMEALKQEASPTTEYNEKTSIVMTVISKLRIMLPDLPNYTSYYYQKGFSPTKQAHNDSELSTLFFPKIPSLKIILPYDDCGIAEAETLSLAREGILCVSEREA